MKFQLTTALCLSLHGAAASSSTLNLSASGRALLEARIDQLDANAKRCLVEDDMDAGLCQAIIDPLLSSSGINDNTVVISEASMGVESPASLEGDNLGSDFGEPQVLDVTNEEGIRKIIEEARVYMAETVRKDEKYIKVRDICKNENAQCAFWASVGECEKNPAYMKGKQPHR